MDNSEFINYDNFTIDFSEDGIRSSCVQRIPTGFRQLDKLIQGGLGPELTVLGAISSLGKSTFAIQMAQNISARKLNGKNIPVLFFSLEMSRQNIALKMAARTAFELAAENETDYSECKARALSSAEISGTVALDPQKAALRERTLSKCREETSSLYIIERDANHLSFSADTITGTVDSFMKAYPETAPVVFVDYLQILSSSSNNYGTKNERQIVDENISQLWLLAKNKQIPVFVISSVNRESYNKPISFAAFKESGAIEFTADVVLGMQFSALRGMDKSQQKQFSADNEKKYDPRRLEIKVLKQRYGRSGDDVYCDFNYYPAYSCFKECTENQLSASAGEGSAAIPNNHRRARSGGVRL